MTGPTTPAGWDTAHYTPQQIAEMLQVSVDTVRGIFAEMDGVVRIERPRPNRRARIERILAMWAAAAQRVEKEVEVDEG